MRFTGASRSKLTKIKSYSQLMNHTGQEQPFLTYVNSSVHSDRTKKDIQPFIFRKAFRPCFSSSISMCGIWIGVSLRILIGEISFCFFCLERSGFHQYPQCQNYCRLQPHNPAEQYTTNAAAEQAIKFSGYSHRQSVHYQCPN